MTTKYEPPKDGFRTFLIAWGTQSISVFGSALTLFAMNIWLAQTLYPLEEQKPQLAVALSMINIAFAIPAVFGAPLAGAWVDRHDRKRTMIVMDCLNGGLTLLMGVLIATGILQLWMLIGLIFLSSFVSSFHFSAFDTSYAMLVPEDKLARANGMMQTIWALSGIFSPALAAIIIGVPALARQGRISGLVGDFLGRLNDGAALAMGIDALTFFLAAGVLVFLTIPSPKHQEPELSDEPKQPWWGDLSFGFIYIWNRRPLLWLLGTFALANFTAGPLGVLAPMLVKFNMQENWTALGFSFEAAMALMGTVGAVGGVLGGILISAWGGLKARRVYGVVVPMILAGLGQVIYGMTPILYVAAVATFFIDAMLPVMNSHSQTIWQTQTPHELQGRVFAVRRVIAQFSWPLSSAMAGLLSARFDPGLVVALLGGVSVIFCVAQLFNPYLVRVEDRAWLERLAAEAEGRLDFGETV